MAAIDIDGGVPSTTLNGAITSGATSITVTDGSAYPDGTNGNFYIVIDLGAASEETIECSSRSSNTFTVATRGADGSSATSHDNGAVVQHVVPALTLQEANTHANQTTGAPHGSAYVTPSGNVATATAWATGRNIVLSGDVSGTSGSFDGSANATITTTVADDSHNHTSSTITGTLSNSTTGNAATATKWASPMTLTVSGDMSGSVSFDGSAAATLTVTSGGGGGGSFNGDIVASNGTSVVLDNGTNGTDALFKGDVQNSSGTTIVDVSAAEFKGKADTAAKWHNQRQLSLTGAVTGSVYMDGSQNVSMTTTIGSVPASSVTSGTFNSGSYTFPSNLTVSGQINAGTGSASAPSIYFGDIDTGFNSSSGGGSINVALNSSNRYQFTTAFKPLVSGADLGGNSTSQRWNNIYAANTTISTSDDRLKVRDGAVLGSEFILNLDTFAGYWAHETQGDENTRHFFVSGQDVVAELEAAGVDVEESFLVHKDDDSEEYLSIAYAELIPCLVKTIQELNTRLEAVEG